METQLKKNSIFSQTTQSRNRQISNNRRKKNLKTGKKIWGQTISTLAGPPTCVNRKVTLGGAIDVRKLTTLSLTNPYEYQRG